MLQLRQHSSYLACAIVRLIVMLARAIFRSCGEFCTCVNTRPCDRTCLRSWTDQTKRKKELAYVTCLTKHKYPFSCIAVAWYGLLLLVKVLRIRKTFKKQPEFLYYKKAFMDNLVLLLRRLLIFILPCSDVSKEACQQRGAALNMTVWDRDRFYEDDIAGEVFVDLSRILGLEDNITASFFSIPQVELPLIHGSIIGQTFQGSLVLFFNIFSSLLCKDVSHT